MTSNLLENVQVYFLSQVLTRYCMVYILAIRRKLEFVFRINHILKNLMLKILSIYFYFMEYYITIQKKE